MGELDFRMGFCAAGEGVGGQGGVDLDGGFGGVVCEEDFFGERCEVLEVEEVVAEFGEGDGVLLFEVAVEDGWRERGLRFGV